MSWVGQHPITGTKTLNKSTFSSPPPKPPTKIPQQLLPWDEREKQTGVTDLGTGQKLYVKHWSYGTKWKISAS